MLNKNIQVSMQNIFNSFAHNERIRIFWNSLLSQIYEYPKKTLMKPALYRLGSFENSWAQKAKSYDLKTEKLQKNIRVYQYGSDGPTILLMHGWGGRGLQLAPLIQPLLDLSYQVVLFDATGHGESEGKGSTYFEFVESLRAVAQKYENISGIVAHSMGCGAAVVLAADLSHEIKTVLIAPHYDMKEEFLSWARSIGAPTSVLSAFIRLSEIRFDYRFDDLNPKNITHLTKGPFLLIHDVGDKAAKFKSSELLHAAIKNSRLIRTEGKGHNKIIGDPEIIKNIQDFFKIITTGSRV